MPVKEKNLDIAPGETKTCPATGLPVLIKPEWININRGGSYRVTCGFIGRNIMLAMTSGYVKLPGLKEQLAFADELASTYLPEDGPYVRLENYAGLKGVSLEARNFYTGFMMSKPGLKGIIYYNVPPVIAFSIKLLKRLTRVKFEVRIVDDYQAAVKLAQRILDTSVTVNPEWRMTHDRFSLKCEVIGEDIFHSLPSGYTTKACIGPSFVLKEKVIRTMAGSEQGRFYYLLSLDRIEGIQRQARKLYVQYMTDLYKRRPFQVLVIYGARRSLKGAITLARLFVPFPVRVVGSLEGGLDLIAELKRRKAVAKPEPDSSPDRCYSGEQVQGYIDEVLRFLGSIDWKADGVNGIQQLDPAHPFSQIFDALAFIKSDLDNLFEEREKAEQEKEKLVEQLSRARKMEAIGVLAGGVAHDLNNILGGIMSYPELLLMQVPPDSPLRKHLLTIQKSGEKAAAVVQDLLTLARRGVPFEEITNLNGIVSDYFKSPEFERLKNYHGQVEFETLLDQNLLNIKGSGVHLFNTVMNLVANSAEAITGRGLVTVATQSRYIDRALAGFDQVAEGEYVILEVSDNGVGLNAEEIERIFEPFYTKKVMGRSGTGLGMAVVWGTVKDHHGYIDVKSSPGRGSTFTLYFPANRSDVSKVPEKLPVESYRGHGELVLIADDVAEQREIAGSILEKIGYRVITVDSGEAAVEYLRHNRADILVLDMIMDPGLDGLETYRKIRHLRPEQKVIIASGYSETDRVKEAQALGVGAYIKKPYTLEKLGVAVRNELSRKPDRD